MPEEKSLLSDYYALGFDISVSEIVTKPAIEKIENEINTRDLLEAIEEDAGERYSMAEVIDIMRETTLCYTSVEN